MSALAERSRIAKPLPLAAVRRVVHRTRGNSHGPITRLVSPSDLGELLKPFVFLDHFDLQPKGGEWLGIHPHSGIATFTLLLSGSVGYEDTTGKSGVLLAGGLEWMRAGGGVWHDGRPADSSRMHGLQLWVALPPELENARRPRVSTSRRAKCRRTVRSVWRSAATARRAARFTRQSPSTICM